METKRGGQKSVKGLRNTCKLALKQCDQKYTITIARDDVNGMNPQPIVIRRFCFVEIPLSCSFHRTRQQNNTRVQLKILFHVN
jgi:hypothetical protein